jgi:hypothetical protein
VHLATDKERFPVKKPTKEDRLFMFFTIKSFLTHKENMLYPYKIVKSFAKIKI